MAACFRGNMAQFVRVKWVGRQARVVTYAARQMSGRSASELAKAAGTLRIGGHSFSTLLDGSDYQLMSVEAPNVPPEEMKSAVRWRIKDTLSYRVDDATVDVVKIPSDKPGGERAQSLYVVAASNDVIRKRIALFEDAKLDLDVIDIPEMAQRNIAALFEDEGRGLAVLAFDESGGILTFSGGGELFLARRIEISLGQLQDADENLRRQSFDRLELEVQRSLDYFDRQFNHLAVSRLLLAVPRQTALVGVLQENLDVDVERLDLTQVMDLTAIPELANSDEAQVDAFHALGAAMRMEGRAQ
ncbi:MAG TPA: agglutinin biogenesis protein MshI [Gallionellaceae bacterium]|nr:agglutinin biogenesis protein MshI [Gallionellaceae bacterium]